MNYRIVDVTVFAGRNARAFARIPFESVAAFSAGGSTGANVTVGNRGTFGLTLTFIV